MLRLLLRLARIAFLLLGITFVVFVVMGHAPVDRAELAVARAAADRSFADAATRDEAILRLRVRYGIVDPVTLEPAPLWRRYGTWLRNAATLGFGDPGDDHDALLARLGAALPVTVLLNLLALVAALTIGIPLGTWLGQRAGSRADRAASSALFVALGVPEFLAATLLSLAFTSAWLQWLPATGLRSPGSEQWSFVAQVADLARHLVLPVAVLAIGPGAMIARFVRDVVARAAQAPFVATLHALGATPREVRRRLWRHGCTPVATLLGNLLPTFVGGSLVVESVFAIDGLGHLAVGAAHDQDQPMLMAIVVMTSIVTLFALSLSDWLHRAVDARVQPS
jgi:ABC-type dipeptide/oligopeptide/nickel transport system permease component